VSRAEERPGDVRTAVLCLAVLGIVAGVAGLGLALADGRPLLDTSGTRVLGWHHTSPFGGLVIAVLSGVALVGGLRGSRLLAGLAGSGYLLAAMAVVAGGAVRELNVLGGIGSTLSVLFALGAGLLACAPVLAPKR
jgi:hypothetical protein